MQNNDVLYEITQMIQNKQDFNEDINRAILAFSNVFKEKYINKLQNAVVSCQNAAKNNPTKEIALLQALKPYAAANSGKVAIDNAINAFTTINAIKSMGFSLHPNNPPVNVQSHFQEDAAPLYYAADVETANASIHEDGIYDTDEACLVSKNSEGYKNSKFSNMLLMFALMSGLR